MTYYSDKLNYKIPLPIRQLFKRKLSSPSLTGAVSPFNAAQFSFPSLYTVQHPTYSAHPRYCVFVCHVSTDQRERERVSHLGSLGLHANHPQAHKKQSKSHVVLLNAIKLFENRVSKQTKHSRSTTDGTAF